MESQPFVQSARTRRGVPLSLKLAALPPLDMGSPMMNEKDQLPCIMITPSSPVHEFDYEVLYFEPEKPKPGFFSTIRQSLWPSHPVALPETPRLSDYGYSATTSSTASWTAGKRFRWILMVLACLFLLAHVVALPKIVDGGLHEVFTTHHGSNQMMDDVIAPWEEFDPSSAASHRRPSGAPAPVETPTGDMYDGIVSASTM